LDIDSTTAVDTFESEIYINFKTKEDADKFVDKSLFENTDFAFENYASKHWEDMTRENIRSEMGTENWPYDISVTGHMPWRMTFKSDGSYASKAILAVSRAMKEMKIDTTDIVHTQTLPDDPDRTVVDIYRAGNLTPKPSKKKPKTKKITQ
jgi:hypothetical protein